MTDWRDVASVAATKGGRGAMLKVGIIALVVFLLLLLFLAPFAGTGNDGGAPADPCSPEVVQVGGPTDGSVQAEQESIARTANNVATEMNMPGRAVLVIYMTGLQESGMRDLDYGDRDSLGWLQQRPSQGWGSETEVREIEHSSRRFYEALQRVPAWQLLSLNDAAQAVQSSGYGEAYAKHEDRAREIAATIGADLDREGDPDGPGPASGPAEGGTTVLPVDVTCGGQIGELTGAGWAHPVPGFTTYWGNYGQWRETYRHAGEDLAAPGGQPILAASNGVVSHVSCTSYAGRSPCNIQITHAPDAAGRTVQTLYVHMWPNGVLVQLGQQVAAGELIGRVGTNGNSSGNHLHFEVWVSGVEVNPTTFLAAVGIDLRNPRAQLSTPPGSESGVSALAAARQQLGKPYLWGGNGPDSFDCSGLTRWAWAAAGRELPRHSGDQWTATTRIERAQLRPGDLVFWSSNGTADGIYHVALYAGDGKILQAPSPGSNVEEVSLYDTNLLGYGRLA